MRLRRQWHDEPPAVTRLPGVCIVCRAPLVWVGKDRRHSGQFGDWRMAENPRRRHVCPLERQYCGAWMPNAKERCARHPGHAFDRTSEAHSSAWAMANDAARTRGAA